MEDVIARSTQLAAVSGEGHAGACTAPAVITAASTSAGATATAEAEGSVSLAHPADDESSQMADSAAGQVLSPPSMDGVHRNLDQAALPQRCTRSSSARKQVLAKAEDAKHLFATGVTVGACVDGESVAGSLHDSCSGRGVGSMLVGEERSSEAVAAKRRWLDGFVDVLSLDEVTVLKWPVDMICYTAAQPSVSYCCNPLHFDFRAGSCTTLLGSPVRRSTGTAGDIEDVVSRVVEGLLVAVENANKSAEVSCCTTATSDLAPIEVETVVRCNGSKLSSKTDALFSCKAKIGSGSRRRQYRWKKKNATGLNNGKNPGDDGETEGYAGDQAEESAAKHGMKDKQKQKKRKKKKRKEKKHKKRRRSMSPTKSDELAAIPSAVIDDRGSSLRSAVADLAAAGQPCHPVTSGETANGLPAPVGRKHRKRKGHKRKAKGARPEKRPCLERLDCNEPGTCSPVFAPAVAAVTPVSTEHAVDRDTCSSAAGPALQPSVTDAVKSAHVKGGSSSCSEEPAAGSSKGGTGKLADSGLTHRPLSGDGARKKYGGQVIVALPLATPASHAAGSAVPPLAAGCGAAHATALVAPTTAVASLRAASPSSSTTTALPAAPAVVVQGSALPVRGRKLSEGQATSSASCGAGAQPSSSVDVPPKRIKIAFKPVPGCKGTAGDRAILEPTVVSRWDSSSSDSEDEQRRKATLFAILGESRSSSNGRSGELRPADAAVVTAASLSPSVAPATSAATLGLQQKLAEPQRGTIHEPSPPSSVATAERERQAARGNRRAAAGAVGGPTDAATAHALDLPAAAAATAPASLPAPGGSSVGRDRSRSAASSPCRPRRSSTARDDSRSKSSSRSRHHSGRSSSGRRSRSTGSSSGGSRRRSGRSSSGWSSSGSRSGSGRRRRQRRRRRHGRRSSRRRSDDSGGASSSSSRSRSGDSRRSRRSASGRGHRRRRCHRRSQRTYSSSAERSYSGSSSSAERSRSRSRRHGRRTRRHRRYRSGSSSSSSIGGGSRRGSATDSSRSRSGRRPSARHRQRSPSRPSPAVPFGSLLLPSRRMAPGATAGARRPAAVGGTQRPGVGPRKSPPHKSAGMPSAAAQLHVQRPAAAAAAARSQAPTAGVASKQQPPLHEQHAGSGCDSKTGTTNQAGTGDAATGGAGGGGAAVVSRLPSSAALQAGADLSAAAAHVMTVVDKGDQRPFIGPVRPGDREAVPAVQNADIPLPMELPALPQPHHGAVGPRQSPQPAAAGDAAAAVEHPGQQHQPSSTSPATPTAMLLPPEQTEMYRGLQEQAELYRELREQQQRMREAAALRQGQAPGAAEIGTEDVDLQPAPPHEAVVQSYAQQIMMTQRTTMFPQPATVAPSPPPMALFSPTAAALHHQAAAAAAAASQVPVQAGLPLQAGSPVVLAGPSPAAAAAAAMHAQIAAMHAHHQKQQQQQQQLVAHAQAVAHMQQLQAAAAGGLPLHFSGHPGLVQALGGLPGVPMGAHPLHGIHMNGLGPGPGPGGLTFSQAGLSHFMGPGHPALTPGPQMLQLGPQFVHLPMGAHVAGGGQPLVMIQGSPHILLQRIPRGL